MTPDCWTLAALELLDRGYGLYRGGRVAPGVAGVGQRLRTRSDRLLVLAARPGPDLLAARTRRLADNLAGAAAAEVELADLLSAAHADRSTGRARAGALRDDGYADRSPPGGDTPIGRREAARRMIQRLRAQRAGIAAARHRARRLARRIRAIDYPRSGTARGPVTAQIAAALDRLGIRDAAARRRWLRGYQTLIARESSGQPSAVASQPATAAGPIQPDGHRLGYARGLTQTLPTTFARYHQPGTSTDIYNPVANICASMNYVMHRYGVRPDGSNLAALVQQADWRRPPRGY